MAPAIVRAAPTSVLKFVPQADLAVADPIVTTAGVTWNHGNLVFDTLYGVTGPETGFAAVPQMAAGQSVESGWAQRPLPMSGGTSSPLELARRLVVQRMLLGS